jgi:phenylpropionate dioxygenase-like ring-hydroxylating dioxygenase large terminal subunit
VLEVVERSRWCIVPISDRGRRMMRAAVAPSSEVYGFFLPVLPARRLRRAPVQVRVAGEAWVLFRDGEGRPAALLDRCPHRFTLLSRGRVGADGRLACPYHGWRFDADGNGQAPAQPGLARCDVEALQVVERHGYVWIARRDVPASAFPAMQWEGYALTGSFSLVHEAPLHVVLSNLGDAEHSPFVHPGLLLDEARLRETEVTTAFTDD